MFGLEAQVFVYTITIFFLFFITIKITQTIKWHGNLEQVILPTNAERLGKYIFPTLYILFQIISTALFYVLLFYCYFHIGQYPLLLVCGFPAIMLLLHGSVCWLIRINSRQHVKMSFHLILFFYFAEFLLGLAFELALIIFNSRSLFFLLFNVQWFIDMCIFCYLLTTFDGIRFVKLFIIGIVSFCLSEDTTTTLTA